MTGNLITVPGRGTHSHMREPLTLFLHLTQKCFRGPTYAIKITNSSAHTVPSSIWSNVQRFYSLKQQMVLQQQQGIRSVNRTKPKQPFLMSAEWCLPTFNNFSTMIKIFMMSIHSAHYSERHQTGPRCWRMDLFKGQYKSMLLCKCNWFLFIRLPYVWGSYNTLLTFFHLPQHHCR